MKSLALQIGAAAAADKLRQAMASDRLHWMHIHLATGKRKHGKSLFWGIHGIDVDLTFGAVRGGNPVTTSSTATCSSRASRSTFGHPISNGCSASASSPTTSRRWLQLSPRRYKWNRSRARHGNASVGSFRRDGAQREPFCTLQRLRSCQMNFLRHYTPTPGHRAVPLVVLCCSESTHHG